MLEKGTKAPAFTLKDQDGNKVSLKDFLGKKTAIYFYPKDMTPTCTQQACNIRDNFDLLKKKGVEIIGVSADSQELHTKFREKHQLPFTLLSDESKEMRYNRQKLGYFLDLLFKWTFFRLYFLL